MKRKIITLLALSTTLALSAQIKLEAGNIDDIIAAMTLKEKVYFVLGVGDEGVWRHYKTKPTLILRGQACATYGIPRLGIPNTVLTDGPAGLRIDTIQTGVNHRTYCTAFPTATALASTWNKELVYQVGDAIGEETFRYGSDMLLGPAMNIQRNPLTGRNFEYYSEDPYISGMMAASMVNGIQKWNVGACIKHFAANNIETNRRTINAVISQRALREIYLRGFQIAIEQSNPWMIMTSYNKINGYYTAENKVLLQDIVRREWKYDGLFVSDWVSGEDFVAQMRARNELLMPGNYQAELFMKAIKNGTLDEKTLNRNIKNILKYIIKTSTFKNLHRDYQPDLNKHADVSRQAAEEAMVLLQNKNNTLPLKNTKSYALFGKSSYNFIAGGTGSGRVNYRHAASVTEGLESMHAKVLKNLSSFYQHYIDSVRSNTTPTLKIPTKNLVDFAPEPALPQSYIDDAAQKADIAIITLGRNAGELWDREAKDYYYLSNTETTLLKRVCDTFHALNKKVVVVLNIGGPIDVASWRHIPDVILLAWQTGQEGGYALANILSGKVNPSGKLAVSFPVKYSDVPSANSFPGVPAENPVNAFYEEGIYVGYRYYQTFNVKTAYEFGYGLSYTDFTYSPLKISNGKFKDKLTASVTVTNTGKISGKEVVQLYLKAPVTTVEKPFQELKRYAKTQLLKPGESETIEFTVNPMDLASFWTGKSQWIAEKGMYEIRIGASSEDIRSKAIFELDSTIVVSEVNDVLYPNIKLHELSTHGIIKGPKTNDIILGDSDYE